MADVDLKFYIAIPHVAILFDKKLIRRIVGQAGREIMATTKALIGSSAGGRNYGGHIASAPGQPPATLSGLLASSLKVNTRGDTATILDSAFYAVMLEDGAKGGGGKKGSGNTGREHRKNGAKGKPQTQRILAPRPFLSLAAEAEMPSLQSRIQAALSQSIDLKQLKAGA